MKRVVGLDIGSFAIKGVEIEYDAGKTPRVTNFGIVTLPANSVANGEIVDAATISGEIKRLWTEGNFKAKNVVIGVEGSRVFLRDIEMPEMTDAEILSSIRIEASQFLPGDLDEYEVDFERPPVVPTQARNDLNGVHLVASDAQILRQYESIVTEAGLRIESVDASFFSLFRAVAKLESTRSAKDFSPTEISNASSAQSLTQGSSGTPRSGVGEMFPPSSYEENMETDDLTTEALPVAMDDVLAIVVVGAENVSVGIAENGTVTLARSIENRGGDMVTDAISQSFDVEQSRAETLKRWAGSTEAALDGELGTGVDRRSLVDLIRDRSTDIAETISGTLNSYLFQKENTASVRVLVTGGAAMTFGLFEALRNSLSSEITIERLDLFDYLNTDQLQFSPEDRERIAGFTQEALGLALGRWIATSGVRVVNLLGTDALDRRRFINDMVLSGVGVLVLLGAIGGLYALRANQLSSANNQVSAAQAQLSSDQAQLARLSNVAAVKTQLTNQEKQVQAVLTNDVAWPVLVSSFDNATPSDVWWTNFTGVAAQGTQPAGVTIGAMGCSQQAPAHWINGINTISGVLDPWVSSSTASSSIVCMNSPATSGPNNTVVTFNSTATLGNAVTPSRYDSYLTGEGISQ